MARSREPLSMRKVIELIITTSPAVKVPADQRPTAQNNVAPTSATSATSCRQRTRSTKNQLITDEALEGIGKLTKLVRLNLSGTAITTAGIGQLKTLQNLEYINIVNTKADDAGLLILSNIPSLKNIYCWNSLITASGIEKYKTKMPAVHIVSGDKQ